MRKTQLDVLYLPIGVTELGNGKNNSNDPKHVFVGIFTETYFGRAKIHCFSFISDMSQVVLKRFSARTSIVFMLLFSWLDRGVDILDVLKKRFFKGLMILIKRSSD